MIRHLLYILLSFSDSSINEEKSEVHGNKQQDLKQDIPTKNSLKVNTINDYFGADIVDKINI